MKRGTIVWVDLSDAHPPETGKVRPAVIVSGDVHNATLDTVVVVPTSSLAPEILPLRVNVGIFAGKESFAVVPGLRQVSKRRLRGTLGLVATAQLAGARTQARAIGEAGTEVAPGHRNGVNHFLAEFIRQLPQLPGFQPAQIGRNVDLVEKRGFKRHENGSQSMNL